jgi:hypothetical protein
MEVPPFVYIMLLAIVIIGPILANVSFNGWRNIILSRIFLALSALAMISLMIIVLMEI